jgi:hypothetical protein
VWNRHTEDVVDLAEGVIPLADISNPMEAVDFGELQIFLQPGAWRVRCRCEGKDTGTSHQMTVDYDVLEKTDPPELLATAGAYSDFCFCFLLACFFLCSRVPFRARSFFAFMVMRKTKVIECFCFLYEQRNSMLRLMWPPSLLT